MIRSILFASISYGGVLGEAHGGMKSCACLGVLPSKIATMDCTYSWASNGRCVEADGLRGSSNFTTYSADYGAMCASHKEPGSTACFDLSKSPPVELVAAKADWCDSKWCYVDPCNCDSSDPTKSDYFPSAALSYSYATCGDKNTYVAAAGSAQTVGNADCSVTGNPGCACLGALPSTIADVDCTYSWAFNGKCVDAKAGLSSNFTMYPADYGETCKSHKEPGQPDCFDLSATPPVELAAEKKAGWCDSKWCYVDPCACSSGDATASDYFPTQLSYSYATCGDQNNYVSATGSSATVGGASCGLLTGMKTCACLGALPSSISAMPCTYSWGANGMCVTIESTANFTAYAADYGTVCKIHKEPSSSSCFDLSKSPPVELVTGKASWCDDKWCYVDPCNCDASDPTKSDYFPSAALSYSYATCGAQNKYVGAVGSAQTVGNADCPVGGQMGCGCLGALPSDIPDVDCTYAWAYNGKCVDASSGLDAKVTMYPADYGESCKAHAEPGWADCFDTAKDPPVELGADVKASWCDSRWCYVDPCACNAPDMTPSDYFPKALHYSYATCGDTNNYVAATGSATTVGSSVCASPTPSEGSPSPTPETTSTTKTVAMVSFTINGLDLTDLSDDDQTALKAEFKTAHAALAGVSEDKVKIMLEAGSIVVKAEIETRTTDTAEAIKTAMADAAAATAITEKVKSSPTLLKAAEAKGLTADDLSASAPTTEVVTVTEAPSASPSPSPSPTPTTTKKANSKEASGAPHVVPSLLFGVGLLVTVA